MKRLLLFISLGLIISSVIFSYKAFSAKPVLAAVGDPCCTAADCSGGGACGGAPIPCPDSNGNRGSCKSSFEACAGKVCPAGECCDSVSNLCGVCVGGGGSGGCACGGAWSAWSCSKSCPAGAQNGGFCGYTKTPPIVPKVNCRTYSCNVCPSCSATAPAITGFTKGATYNIVTVNWTPGNVVSGGTQQVMGDRVLTNITAGCPGTCDINASVGPSINSYTANNLIAGSIYYWRIINQNSLSCTASSGTSAYMSSCTLLPSVTSITTGSTAILQNSIDASAVSAIANVSYTSSNPSGLTVTSPDSNGSNGYTTTVTGVTAGPAVTVTSTVNTASYGALCTSTSNVTVISQDAWWQVKDADVATNGDLKSIVTGANVFGLNGPGGFPGIPSYGGTTNLTGANISSTRWLAASPITSLKIYNYQFFINQVPSGTTFNTINQGDNVASKLTDPAAVADSNGYYWFKYNGASFANQDLTIPAVNLGARKAILFVDSARANIAGNINVTYGSGFFMLIAGANASGVGGTILVSPTVGGGAAANLEGIYISDNNFIDGTNQPGSGDIKLWVRGTVVANGSASIQRDLGGILNANPSELFEYAPDQIMLIPKVLTTRHINWKEVAP